jgi:hypothetical protein
VSPFQQFALEFLAARGAALEEHGPLDWEAKLPADLAKRFRKPSLRLVFDADRATLPRGAQFAAPGSQVGLKLMREAREGGHIGRFHALAKPNVDARAVAGEGLVLHDVEAKPGEAEPARPVVQIAFHATLTFKGGSPEQDLRSVLADPRGPQFDFWEPEDRKRAELEPGFPPDYEPEPIDRAQLWTDARVWLERVLEPRAERWRKKVEEQRERDLARLNAFYQTRIQEERDRRRRRRSDDPESEEPATEAALKLEWGRRTRAVRARYAPAIEIHLWGIEEIARPRQAVRYALRSGGKPAGTFTVEVDLASGALVRPPCPVCGRAAGEFWWDNGGLVCRRCRGRGRAPKSGDGRPANRGRKSG